DGRQCCTDLCAEPAAVVGASNRLRCPQQCGLFHQMVPGIPQGEVRPAAGKRPARNALNRLSSHNRRPTKSRAMKDVFARLGTDFLSTILFLVIYLATDNVLLATGVAIAGAIGQVIYSRVKG